MVHEHDRKTTRNTENRHDDADRYGFSPVDELRQTRDASAMTDDYTRRKDDMILRRLAECDENYISTDIDSSAVILNDVTFRRLILPRRQISADHDKSYARVSAGRDMIDSFCRLRGS